MIWGDGDGRRVTRVMNRMPLMNRHTGRTKAGTRTWRARLDDEQCAEHKKEKHDEHRGGKHDEPREETRDTSNDNARRTIRIARRMTRNGGAASAAEAASSSPLRHCTTCANTLWYSALQHGLQLAHVMSLQLGRVIGLRFGRRGGGGGRNRPGVKSPRGGRAGGDGGLGGTPAGGKGNGGAGAKGGAGGNGGKAGREMGTDPDLEPEKKKKKRWLLCC